TAADPAAAAPETAIRELAALRQSGIELARTAQQRETELAMLEQQLRLLGRDAEGRQRGLDESRPEQEQLLRILERLARQPPARALWLADAPLDRARGRILMTGVLAGLRDEAHALSGEIDSVAALRSRIAAKKGE